MVGRAQPKKGHSLVSIPIRNRKPGQRPFGTWLDYAMIAAAAVLFLLAMMHLART